MEDVMAAHRCSPNIVVIPTDNRSLLEKLTRCMGEIDAGNKNPGKHSSPVKRGSGEERPNFCEQSRIQKLELDTCITMDAYLRSFAFLI